MKMLVDMQAAFKTPVKTLSGEDEQRPHLTDVNNGSFEDSSSPAEIKKSDQTAGHIAATAGHTAGHIAAGLLCTADMADGDRLRKNLCIVPYSVTQSLMNTLDTDKGWELVASAAGFTFDQIQQLALHQNKPSGSCTKALLWDLGCKLYSVQELYDILKSAGRFREMGVLETYVKEGGIERKGAVGGKSDYLSYSSVFSLSSQTRSTDNKSQGLAEFNYPASDININTSFVERSKQTVGLSKKYNDKVIPGTHGEGLPSVVNSGAESEWPFMPPMRQQTENEGVRPPARIPPSSLTSANSSQSERVANLPHTSLPESLHKNLAPPSPASPGLNPQTVLNSTHKVSNTERTSTTYSMRELHNATNSFDQQNLIGEGAFGKVFHGTLKQQECAIKQLHLTREDKRWEQIQGELDALTRYRHENIVPMYGYVQDETYICLVCQYLVNGSLEDRIFQKNNTAPLPWERRLNIMLGACKGLNFLHTMGTTPLIHGDIKSANILLDQYFEAKIGDLGQAKYATSQTTDTTGFTHITRADTRTKTFGTKAYMAPELSSMGTQSVKSDVFAMGVVFLEVCSAQKAYDPNRNEQASLPEYFQSEFVAEEARTWREQFQDRHLTDAPDDIFLDVLNLSAKCIKKVKKQRPDSTKLLREVKELYNRNKEYLGEDGDSVGTSLQPGSRSTGSSSSLNSLTSQYVMSPPVNLHYSTQPGLYHHQTLQEQPTHQQHSSLPYCKQSGASHLQQQLSELSSPQQQPQVLQSTFSCPGGLPGVDFRCPTEVPLSVPLRLQLAYDNRQNINCLSALSLKSSPQFENNFDPLKLQKADEQDKQVEKCSQSEHPVLQSPGVLNDNAPLLEENFPPSDPKKLAQLKAFDANSEGTGQPVESDNASLRSDPHKLAYLTKFQNTYQNDASKTVTPKEADNLRSSPALAEGRIETYKMSANNPQGFLGVFPHQGQPAVSNNDSMVAKPISTDSHYSDYSSYPTNPSGSIKPGKGKINFLMDRYSQLKSEADLDGEGQDQHSENEDYN